VEVSFGGDEMRIAIIGNSGSGKSTLAQRLAKAYGAQVVDLDTVAWEPGEIARPRSAESAAADVRSFCESVETWIVEGCYATLVGVALEYQPHLLFLDPGVEQCLANCRARPWEPHKYSSKAEQDEKLAFLLSWVADYYRRDGEMSHQGHQALFQSYIGPKQRLDELPGRDFDLGPVTV
jgi:adenylate kinase family enzyme